MAEAGFPSFDLRLMRPGGTGRPPDAIVSRWNELTNEALRDPKARERISALDYDVRGGTTHESPSSSAREICRYKKKPPRTSRLYQRCAGAVPDMGLEMRVAERAANWISFLFFCQSGGGGSGLRGKSLSFLNQFIPLAQAPYPPCTESERRRGRGASPTSTSSMKPRRRVDFPGTSPIRRRGRRFPGWSAPGSRRSECRRTAKFRRRARRVPGSSPIC